MVLLAIVVVGLSGCSMFYRKGRPDVGDPPSRYVRCTNVYGPVVIDALITASLITASIVAVNQADDGERGAAAALFVGPAIFGASGIYGYVHVDDCSKHHEAWARAHPESPNGPIIGVPYQPPHPPPLPPHQQQQQPPPPGVEGAVCMPNNLCTQGLQCNAGICTRLVGPMPPPRPAPPAPPAPTIGGPGYACKSDGNCARGYTCGGSGTCVQIGTTPTQGPPTPPTQQQPPTTKPPTVPPTTPTQSTPPKQQPPKQPPTQQPPTTKPPTAPPTTPTQGTPPKQPQPPPKQPPQPPPTTKPPTTPPAPGTAGYACKSDGNCSRGFVCGTGGVCVPEKPAPKPVR